MSIKVENLSKIYKLYDKPIDRLKESIHPFRKKYHRDFYALKDINFEIEKGETVGIIGKNGSGKSTLLKIISGVLTPTSGIVTVNGKVSALLELGTGFNPEFTGIENIYFSGTIMGYTKEEIDSKLDDILSFADIGDFVCQPVKTYSSGMFVRLAFAVAINVDPEILIVDEALSVGDIRFQQKCFRKINEFKDNNKTILFVSHDIGSVIKFCSNVIWLKDGELYHAGDANDTCKRYISYMVYDNATSYSKAEEEIDKTDDPQKKEIEMEWEDVISCSYFGDGGAEIKRTTLHANNLQKKINMLYGGERVIFSIEISVKRDILSPIVGFIMNDDHGNPIIGTNNNILGTVFRNFTKGDKLIVNFGFEFPYLKDGYYSFSPAIAEGTLEKHVQQHWVHDAYIVQVASKDEAARMGWFLIPRNTYISIENLNCAIDKG